MLRTQSNPLTPFLLLALAACGGTEAEEGTGERGPPGRSSQPTRGANERGGPHSLIGYDWTSDPLNIQDIEFVVRFRFDETHLTATGTCDGELSATTEVPVRYRYTATVPAGDRVDEAKDGNTCFAAIQAGSFDFEIVGDKLVVTSEGETVEFSADGTVSGLYGKWATPAPGIGTLTWAMGGGKIVATSQCDNGVSASVEVDATFINKLEITESAEKVVEDGFGLECWVSVAAGLSTYRFEGDDLILTTNGEDVRFSAN